MYGNATLSSADQADDLKTFTGNAINDPRSGATLLGEGKTCSLSSILYFRSSSVA